MEKKNDLSVASGEKNDFSVAFGEMDNKFDISFADGREWGVYVKRDDIMEWIEGACTICKKKAYGIETHVYVHIVEIVDSRKMITIDGCPFTGELASKIASHVESGCGFTCEGCIETL